MAFENLTEQANPPADIYPQGQRVIKSGTVQPENVHKLELPSIESQRPTIVLQHTNGSGGTLEFVCACGCTTTVELEFGDTINGLEARPSTGESEPE